MYEKVQNSPWFRERGKRALLARELGITPQAIYQWRQVPAERAPRIAAITGIPLHELRPDLYPAPEAGSEPTTQSVAQPMEEQP